ncbi:urease accessory protein UreD [Pseudofrankia asymbiotica]|uniref:Urease accessory protein UreD n=1 Tax=Pseudofrankia asymbiotica TaxID=1834516 RepID=A0A1V2I8I6_9ACTN|nr:urease accessory protein UreD [Pseudofrankia asymbiotica]
MVRAHEVRAHAVLRVEAGPDGSARVVEARSAIPLVLRHTDTTVPRRAPSGAAPERDEARRVQDLTPPVLPTVTMHLVGAAAGPLAGDQLRLDISVGPGVRLVLRSVAATLAMPGHGPGPSVMEIHADVAAGGALDLLPEPTVAVRGCRHRMVGRAVVAAGGWLRWREEVLLGRFGEPSGQVETDLRVDIRVPADDPRLPAGDPTVPADERRPLVGDRPLLRQQLLLGPDVPGLTGAALLGSARAVGSLLIAAPAALSQQASGPGPAGLGVPASVTAPAASGGARTPGGAAVLPLAGPGVLVTALAADAVTLRRHLGP